MAAVAEKLDVAVGDEGVADDRKRLETLTRHDPVALFVGDWDRTADKNGGRECRRVGIAVVTPPLSWSFANTNLMRPVTAGTPEHEPAALDAAELSGDRGHDHVAQLKPRAAPVLRPTLPSTASLRAA